MIRCDNIKCKYNEMELCSNKRLIISRERCTCFERKYRRSNKTDLNHEPVIHRSRKRVIK